MKKKLRVVIDTNIFISALLGGRSCKFIVECFEKGEFTLVLSPSIIKEIRNVLTTKEIGSISEEETEQLFKAININAEIVKPSLKLNLCRHPEDDKILEAAGEAKTNFVVTGDKDLLTIKSFQIPIITPKEFLEYLKKNPS